MKKPIIKCSNGTAAPHSFYVLCKGENSGKPLRQPCANCFMVTASDADECDYWYWLSWGLWKSQRFQQLLRGSVIPFIRIGDYEEVITTAAVKHFDKPQLLTDAINTMRAIEEHENLIKNKLALLAEAKRSIFIKILRQQQ